MDYKSQQRNSRQELKRVKAGVLLHLSSKLGLIEKRVLNKAYVEAKERRQSTLFIPKYKIIQTYGSIKEDGQFINVDPVRFSKTKARRWSQRNGLTKRLFYHNYYNQRNGGARK